MRSGLLLGSAALLLAGCAGAVSAPRGNAPATAGMRPAINDHRGSAVQGQASDLLGRDRAALVGLFGAPRLDHAEGTAQRLQFASERCVLDAYLYPRREGSAPVVTHVDARTPDGADADRADCINALRRR